MVARTVRGATSADVVDERSRRRAPRSETVLLSDLLVHLAYRLSELIGEKHTYLAGFVRQVS